MNKPLLEEQISSLCSCCFDCYIPIRHLALITHTTQVQEYLYYFKIDFVFFNMYELMKTVVGAKNSTKHKAIHDEF